MFSAATNKSKQKNQPSLTFQESKCTGSSHWKSSLVASWWQNVCSSFWLYICSLLNWEEICFRISLFRVRRIFFPRSVQQVFSAERGGHLPFPKPVPVARPGHGLNILGLNSWTNHGQGMELLLNQWRPLPGLGMASIFREVFGLCWERWISKPNRYIERTK